MHWKMIFFIGSCNRIYANCRNITLNIVIRKSKVIKECQKYIRRIPISFSDLCFVQLIDDEYQVGFSSL